MAFTNLRQYIALLRKEGEIVDVEREVDSDLEIAEIHRRVIAADGPALFFHKVKNSPFPVVTNLFGTPRRVALCFGPRPEKIVKEMVELIQSPPSLKTLFQKRGLLKSLAKVGTKKKKCAAVRERRMESIDLEKIPLLKTWPEDGGHFVTLPLVYTEPHSGGPPNLGMYRIQRYNKTQAGLHFQIGKGGGFHYHEAEKANKPLPVNIFIGGSPALILSAIAPLPENVPEILLAALLQGQKLHTSRYNDSLLINECEFALVGHAKPKERRIEGPFGDHYGYYSLEHEFPLFHCDAVFHRKDAIYPATVVGKPKQEDYYIGEYLQRLLAPIFPIVMTGVKDLWSYGETGFHSLAAAVVKDRYPREALSSAFRILGEGQLAFTKFLLVTDQAVNLQNFKSVLQTVLERMQPERDLYIFSNLCLDTLDYTGPKLNEGSRGVLVGVGEKVRNLPEKAPLENSAIFCPGCLVVENSDPKTLAHHPALKNWPLVILVDNLRLALKDDTSFLWTVFTRFEPGADIHVAEPKIIRHHIAYSFPIVIDARMKSTYPKEVLPDAKTEALVSENWNKYFPHPVAMGDSRTAHVI